MPKADPALDDGGPTRPPRLLRRWWRRAVADTPTSLPPSRSAVHPPAVWGQAEPVWRTLWNWLRAGDAPEQRRLSALEQARRDFTLALADLDSDSAVDLRRRGQSARSLRELWHLRADLYSLVARHLSQAEANRRLAIVNRHFPSSTKPANSRPSIDA
ncbi:MAG: hypothetical protein U1F53_13235 [Burkholderiaceae bacterium]